MANKFPLNRFFLLFFQHSDNFIYSKSHSTPRFNYKLYPSNHETIYNPKANPASSPFSSKGCLISLFIQKHSVTNTRVLKSVDEIKHKIIFKSIKNYKYGRHNHNLHILKNYWHHVKVFIIHIYVIVVAFVSPFLCEKPKISVESHDVSHCLPSGVFETRQELCLASNHHIVNNSILYINITESQSFQHFMLFVWHVCMWLILCWKP